MIEPAPGTWEPLGRHHRDLWHAGLLAGLVAAGAELSAVRLPAVGAAMLLVAFWAGYGGGWAQIRQFRSCALSDADPAAPDLELSLAPRRLPAMALVAAAAAAVAAFDRGTWTSLGLAAFLLGAGGFGIAAGRASAAWERSGGMRLYRLSGARGTLVPSLAAVAASPPAPEPRALRRLFRIAPLPAVLAAALLPFVAAATPAVLRPLPTITGFSHESRIEPTFGRAASRLAEHRVTVRCWSPADWPRVSAFSSFPLWGFARPQEETVNLAPWVCDGLARIAYTRAHRPSFVSTADVYAPAVLAHEVAHLGGAGRNERRAECDAVQTMDRAAVLLGADPAYAARIARAYWLRDYPRRPARYRSPQCRPGGSFDLRLAAGWP